MSTNIVPVSIAPLGLLERLAHDAQVAPEAQQSASQQIALETLRKQNKQVQEAQKGGKSFVVGDETPEERKQRRQNAQTKDDDPEENPDTHKREWAGQRLDVKI